MSAERFVQRSTYRDLWQNLKTEFSWTLSRLLDSPTFHLEFQVAQQRFWGLIWLLLFALLGALVSLTILRFEARWVWIAWALYIMGALAILWKPVSGLYLVLFLSLLGDSVILPAYPFNKNFSSAESIFYINDRIIISALEVYLVLTVLSWLLRVIARKRLDFRWGPLGGIILFFFAWVVFGIAYGLSRGGDLTIALWEARALFYLPILYFLAVNLLEDLRQINRVVWLAMIAIFMDGLLGMWAFFTQYHGSLANAGQIMEHSASIHINTMLVLILAAWLYRGSWAKRVLLPLMAMPVLFTYLANQRRASFVALGIALILILVALFRENRKAFNIIAPLAILAIGLYLTAFWKDSSIYGMPARAVRTALVTTVGTRDYTSNLYRLIENVNTTFTIRANLLFGVGFGNKFYILVPMPDISFFEWWQYITHNSILWTWIKTGFPGFIATLWMVGAAIMVGADVYDSLPGGDSKAIGLTMVLYLVMHFIYAYVDMSWDTQSMVYVGVALGILATLHRLMRRPRPRSRAPEALG